MYLLTEKHVKTNSHDMIFFHLKKTLTSKKKWNLFFHINFDDKMIIKWEFFQIYSKNIIQFLFLYENIHHHDSSSFYQYDPKVRILWKMTLKWELTAKKTRKVYKSIRWLYTHMCILLLTFGSVLVSVKTSPGPKLCTPGPKLCTPGPPGGYSCLDITYFWAIKHLFKGLNP